MDKVYVREMWMTNKHMDQENANSNKKLIFRRLDQP